MGSQGDIRRFFKTPGVTSSTKGGSPSPTESTKAENLCHSSIEVISGPSRTIRSPAGETARKKSPILGNHDRPNAKADGAPIVDLTSVSFSSDVTGSSSQRRIRNGETIVLDSDSDSDLEDVTDLLNRFKGQPATAAITRGTSGAASTTSHARQGPTGRKTGLAEKTRAEIRSTQAKSKYSLTRLAANVARERAAAGELEAVLDAIGSSDSRSNVLNSPERKRAVADKLNPSILATMMGDGQGEDGAERLLHAVERTEAARGNRAWVFFDSEPLSPSRTAPPQVLLDRWGSRLEAEIAFREGELIDAARCGEFALIDEDVLNWGFRYTVNDHDEIHQHYCSLLQIAEGQSNWTFTAEWARSMFSILGASDEALDTTRELVPISDFTGTRINEAGWCCVHRVLEIISRMAQSSRNSISEDDRLGVFGLLCKLSMDPSIKPRRNLSFAIQEVMERVLEGISLDSPCIGRFVREFSEQFHDVQLQAKLLKGIIESSPNVAYIRHQMSLVFFFQGHRDEKYPDLLTQLNAYLATSSDLKVRPGMNFAWLTSMIDILDVAVSDGGPEVHPDDMSEANKKRFNGAVDALADRIKLMSSQIRDTGANHISKTEAKEALDILYSRLLFAVRTEPRPKRDVFGKSVGMTRLDSSASLARFLVRNGGRANGDKAKDLSLRAASQPSDDEPNDSADEWYDAGETTKS